MTLQWLRTLLCVTMLERTFWKGAKFAGSVGHPMTKMLSASPPDPSYRLVLRTRHGAPPTTNPFRRL